jgi:hypothetical protein
MSPNIKPPFRFLASRLVERCESLGITPTVARGASTYGVQAIFFPSLLALCPHESFLNWL